MLDFLRSGKKAEATTTKPIKKDIIQITISVDENDRVLASTHMLNGMNALSVGPSIFMSANIGMETIIDTIDTIRNNGVPESKAMQWFETAARYRINGVPRPIIKAYQDVICAAPTAKESDVAFR
jgi:hypothetical protein